VSQPATASSLPEPSAVSTPVIVVGVFPGVPDDVVSQAVVFAERFGAQLVFVYVDTGRYVVGRNGTGEVVSAPIDPDLADDDPGMFPADLREHLASSVAVGIQWSTLLSAGDPADALAQLAEERDATAIVVGTRRASVRSTVGEFFNGSVAAHLAHRQHRPVIVIPVAPVASDEALPWAATS